MDTATEKNFPNDDAIFENWDPFLAVTKFLSNKDATRQTLKPSKVIRNRKRNHFIFENVPNLNLSGRENLIRLGGRDIEVSGSAHEMFLSDEYGRARIANAGKRCKIAIVPIKLIGKSCLTEDARAYSKGFGYRDVFATAMPCLREMVSNEWMERYGIWHIAGLHEPIGGEIFILTRWSGNPGIDSYSGSEHAGWDPNTAFAFLYP